MWQIVVSSPESETKTFDLKPGKTTIGRSKSNDIVIDDISASRNHAEVILDTKTSQVSIVDLNSTNGTYVNRQRILGENQLIPNDIVRIGQVTLNLNLLEDNGAARQTITGTHRFTRELLLESMDEHSILLFEIARKLNTVLNIEEALKEVSEMLKRAMRVDRAEIILAKQLLAKQTKDFNHPLAKSAIETKSAEVSPAAMFVPILGGEELLGLICLFKPQTGARAFNRRDLQLAIAVSHQTALTLQRMYLLDRVRKEEEIHQLLMRFVSPTEAAYLLKDYLHTGQLPGLKEQKVTVLFADIANSTGMAERMGPLQFANILDRFYKESTDIIFKYGGIVKYLGDGVLAMFTEQATGMLMEKKAVLAGQELISSLNRTGSLSPEGHIVAGVSINTGKATAGYVGTQERAEFVVLGDTVNVAYRMQDYARPYKLILGPATVAAISGEYRFRRVGAVSLRGREQTIQVYEVIP